MDRKVRNSALAQARVAFEFNCRLIANDFVRVHGSLNERLSSLRPGGISASAFPEYLDNSVGARRLPTDCRSRPLHHPAGVLEQRSRNTAYEKEQRSLLAEAMIAPELCNADETELNQTGSRKNTFASRHGARSIMSKVNEQLATTLIAISRYGGVNLNRCSVTMSGNRSNGLG